MAEAHSDGARSRKIALECERRCSVAQDAARVRNAALDREAMPSRPWGRGWRAAGVFFSRGGSGLRPPKGYGLPMRTTSYGPQAGEGVWLEILTNEPGMSMKTKDRHSE